MVIGAACLFTFSFLLTARVTDRFTERSLYSPFVMPVYVLVALVFVLGLPLLRKPLARQIVCIVNIVVILVWASLLLYTPADDADGGLTQSLIALLGLVMHVGLLMQWNLHFTLNKVENTAMIVWVSTALSVVLMLLFLNTAFVLPLPLLCALPLLSGVCCWWIEANESSRPESPNSLQSISEYDQKNFSADENPKRSRLLFFAARIGLSVLYGLASGSFVSQSGQLRTNNLLIIMVIAAGAALVLIPMLRYRDKPLPVYFVVVLPILIALSMMSVYLTCDLVNLAHIAVGVAWLVGSVFFHSQLPTYREMTKMDAVRFAYLERVATVIPFALTAALTQLVIRRTGVYAQYAREVDQAIIYYMLMMVIIYSIALTRHLLLYFPRQTAPMPLDTDAVDKSGPDAVEKAMAVAERFMLTKREGEVLVYLSKGYSRLYIEKKLYISKGTAKTHIYRVFSKLGVSSQDELIELVEQG